MSEGLIWRRGIQWVEGGKKVQLIIIESGTEGKAKVATNCAQ